MNRKPPAWDDLPPGGKVLKLYETDLNPGWPRVVVLDLTAEQFEELHKDPVAFAEQYKLFPLKELPSRTSHVAMPPIGKQIPRATPDSRWMATAVHAKDTSVSIAACPQSIIGCKGGPEGPAC
jgi:hypothetical protein